MRRGLAADGFIPIKVEHVSAAMLAERYFAGRTDGLRLPTNSEELLVASA